MAKERPPLEDMTLRQLRKVASEYGISRYSRMRKSQLLEAIQEIERQQFGTPNPYSVLEAQEEVEVAKFSLGQEDLISEALSSVDEGLADLPPGYGESLIVFMPRDPEWAYAYWDVSNEQKEMLRRQGGQQLTLRIYDVTDIDLDYQSPHSIQEYPCDELAREWYLPIPVSDRDYVVEMGYRCVDGRWLALCRSAATRIPPVYPAEWIDDQFITVSWDQELEGKTFYEFPTPVKQQQYGFANLDDIFGFSKEAEAKRIAGSLFGSMHQVVKPQEAISSFVFPSGVGMWASGVGEMMSGVGMSMSGKSQTLSGVGMSGAGMGYTTSGMGMSRIGQIMSGVGMSGAGMGYTTSGMGMSGIGQIMSGVGVGQIMSGVGMSGVGMGVGQTMSGVGMSGVGIGQMMSGIGLTMSGVGMSGVGMGVGQTMSGVGMSGVGMGYTMSGISQMMSGVGLTMSGVGQTMSGVGMSGVGMGYTMSGVGQTMSGVGMSGVGMGYTMSGVGQTMSGVGISMSGVGMSMSGAGLGYTMSGMGMSGIGMAASMPPVRPRKFWLVADAELIIYGATEPDATLTIGGRTIKLSPDGTFRIQMSFQDGVLDFPILAVAADGEQTRSVHLKFERETPERHTNTKDEAVLEWLR